MSDSIHLHDEQRIYNPLDDPKVTDADAIHILLARHRHARGWTRVLGEQLDRGADPLLVPSLDRIERLGRTTRDADLVA